MEELIICPACAGTGKENLKPITISKETIDAMNKQVGEMAKPEYTPLKDTAFESSRHESIRLAKEIMVLEKELNEINQFDKLPKSDQLYKFKKEIRKYRHGNFNHEIERTLSGWNDVGWSIDALEPIESRITIVIQNGGGLLKIDSSGEPIDFTEQERKGTEHLINGEFDKIEVLNEYIMNKIIDTSGLKENEP